MGVLDDLWESATATTPDFLEDIILLPGDDLDSTAIYNFFTGGAYSAVKHSGDMGNYFMALLLEMPDEQEQGITGNKSSNVAKRPVIYGSRGKVGGTRVFVGSSGTNNEYLHIVLDICEGEIEAIDNVYINDKVSTDDKFEGLVTVTKYLGTTTQAADADLVASFTEWTTAHQLKGIAYLHVKLKYNTTAFGGFPLITCDVRGSKVLDCTNYITNGSFAGTWVINPSPLGELSPPGWNSSTNTHDTNNYYAEHADGVLFEREIASILNVWMVQDAVDNFKDIVAGTTYYYRVKISQLDAGALYLAEVTGGGGGYVTIAEFTEPGLYEGTFVATNSGADILLGCGDVAEAGAYVTQGVVNYVQVYESVPAYSTSPALCLRDYLTDSIYGKGLSPLLISNFYFDAASAYQTTQVQKHVGTSATFDLLECNMFLDTAVSIVENTKLLLAANRAALPRTNGNYILVVEKDEVSSFSFNVDNIIGAWSFSGTSKQAKLNEVEVVYTNEDLEWKSDIVVIASNVLFSEDGNTPLTTSLRPQFIVDQYHAQDYGELTIKRSRQAIAGTFVAAPEALSVVPGAIIDITHDTPGWVAKKFRAVDISIMPHGLVGISYVEHEASVYDRDVPLEYIPPPDTNLALPGEPGAPTNITLASGDAYLKVAGDGTIISRIYATWEPPVGYPYVVKYVVEYKAVADTEWIPAPSVLAGSSADIFIGPVDDGVFYHVRVKTVGPNDVESVWLTSVGHSVIGKLAPPPDVNDFSVVRQSDGTRQFSWELTSPPADLAGFKIRYKLSPDQIWGDMLPLHEGLLVLTPYETNLLAAGTYTVGIKAVDTSGNESVNAVLINSVLGDPRIANSVYGVDVRRAEGWPGIKTDCWHSKSDDVLYAKDNKTWDDFFTDGVDWDNWTQYARDPKTPITYEHPAIDIGAIISFVPLASVAGNGALTVEEAHSDDDITYTSWAVIGPQISARYIKVRVTCVLTTGIPSITEMFINLSTEVIEEDINDLITSTVSSPAGVLRLPLSKTYATITQVTIALQNVGAGWTWELIDKNVSTGPQIKIYDNTGTLADATIDAHVKGV